MPREQIEDFVVIRFLYYVISYAEATLLFFRCIADAAAVLVAVGAPLFLLVFSCPRLDYYIYVMQ